MPSTGSVGASGDLAPSAHAFLPLVGEGAFLSGTASDVLRKRGVEPLELRPKEALALINGTHFMAGLGSLSVARAHRLARSADAAAALTIEALRGAPGAFDDRIHELRPLEGQRASAATIRALLAGSERVGSAGRVQDAYSIRCAPQVHGAFREALSFATALVAVDLNAVTDNPIVFAEVSVGFRTVEDLEAALPASSYRRDPLPYQAGFLAGKAFLAYRRRGGARTSPLPDFYIGAHAAIAGFVLLTRDPRRFRSHFPRLKLMAPD